MPDLAEQIRLYLDETARPGADADIVLLRGEPGRPRFGTTRLLVAALVLLIAGVGTALAVSRNGDRAETDVVTDDAPPDAQIDGPTPAPRPSGVRGTTLDWAAGAVPDDASQMPQLLSDGKNLYWIGDRIHTSTDGSNWTTVELDEASVVDLDRMYPVDGVWAGQLILTPDADVTIDELYVQIVGVDGLLRSSVLALDPDGSVGGPPVGVSDTRATIGSRGSIVTATGPSESQFAWHSSDGVSWTSIHDVGPFADDQPGLIQVVATAGGFVGVDNTGRAWSSPDGMEWSDLDDGTDPAGWVRMLAWEDDALVVGVESGLTAVREDVLIPLVPGAPAPSTFGNSVGAGQAGIAYLLPLDADGSDFDLMYSPDGFTWERQRPPGGPGNLYCCYLDAWGVVVGSEKVAVLTHTDSGFELWLGTPMTREQP